MSAGWSLAYKVGLGLLLRLQSERKLLVRHFIKHGSTHRDAFSSWKGIYNFALTMSYLWFGLAAWKMYSIPTTFKDIFYGDFLLRHIFGMWKNILSF
jgi:phosphatidylethanolamine N-methyltransferase